jgi:pimeloyl-[acyl-carrier protein] methyl ester esterase
MAVAYHGWGFDRTCWQPWVERFAAKGIALNVGDRGYFHQPYEPPSERVILVHSYGLHWCPIEHLQQASLLILFSSFLSFHPQQDRNKKRSKFMLSQMTTQFVANPIEVWQAFQVKTYHPAPWEPGDAAMNVERLRDDLKDLETCTLDADRLRVIPQVLILHGSGDRIVATAKGRELWEAVPHSQYGEIDSAGHGLPFSHTAACWNWIEQRLGQDWYGR